MRRSVERSWRVDRHSGSEKSAKGVVAKAGRRGCKPKRRPERTCSRVAGYGKSTLHDTGWQCVDALRADADVLQPVRTATSDRGIKLGGTVLAMAASMVACMNFHTQIQAPGASRSRGP